MDNNNTTGMILWASRDTGTTNIKMWEDEPEFRKENNKYYGKVYLGIFDIKEWTGPTIEEGESEVIRMTIEKA